MFPDTFKNLPNVHVNLHLPQHARNFATLRNTAVGTKEMVHRFFKGLVPYQSQKFGIRSCSALQHPSSVAIHS